jgi:hypothetical protein
MPEAAPHVRAHSLWRGPLLAVVLAAIVTLGGGGVAAADTVLDYDFDSGSFTQPNCDPVWGASPATSASAGLVAGVFSHTASGCDTGWTGHAFTTSFLNQSTNFAFFSFEVTKPVRLDAIVVDGWTNPRFWLGDEGYTVEIGPRNGPVPVPGVAMAQPGYTRLGTLVSDSFDHVSITGPGELAPGTYAVRFIGRSAPFPGTTQLWLDRVHVLGRPADSTPPEITASATLADGGPYEPGSWTNQPVTVHYTCADEPGGSGIPAGTCPADETVSDETPSAGVDVSAGVSDAAGNHATSEPLNVRLDTTAPRVAFTGNRGSYGVDETITVACDASDDLSGVTGDCAGLADRAAAALTPGDHTLDAQVRDRAGNVGSASATFTVVNSPEALARLAAAYSSDPGVAAGLAAKLRAVAASIARGNDRAKAGQLKAFANQVAAQTGKALREKEADTLLRLARAL